MSAAPATAAATPAAALAHLAEGIAQADHEAGAFVIGLAEAAQGAAVAEPFGRARQEHVRQVGSQHELVLDDLVHPRQVHAGLARLVTLGIGDFTTVIHPQINRFRRDRPVGDAQIGAGIRTTGFD